MSDDGNDLITVCFTGGLSERSMQIGKLTPLCVIFSDYHCLENTLLLADLNFVVGEWGEVSSECNANAIDLGIEVGDEILVVWPEHSQQHTHTQHA